MFVPPIFTKLQAESQNVFLCGMGGGYDVFAGIPLYFELTGLPRPKNVILGNLSFKEHVERLQLGKRFTDVCVEVRHADYVAAGLEREYEERLGFPRNYFPELHLSRWFHEKHGKDVPVYTFALKQCTPANMAAAFAEIVEAHNIDTIVLIDAGVDSLLRGDEEGLGTFGEDLLTTLAARRTRVPHRYLMCVGLSTEGGISEFDFLENLAGVQRLGGYLGSVGWLPETPSVQMYSAALAACVPTNSTINAQIEAAVQGHYGHYLPPSIKSRVPFASDLWINPLMAMSWYFDLDKVLEYRKFLDEADAATSYEDMKQRYLAARRRAGVTNRTNDYVGTRRMKYMFR